MSRTFHCGSCVAPALRADVPDVQIEARAQETAAIAAVVDIASAGRPGIASAVTDLIDSPRPLASADHDCLKVAGWGGGLWLCVCTWACVDS